jgi:hypothetical protein
VRHRSRMRGVAVMRRWSRFGGVVLCAGLGVCVLLGASSTTVAGRGVRVASLVSARQRANPLAGRVLFRAPNTPAAVVEARFRARRDSHDAQLMEKIAAQPVASWLTVDSSSSWHELRALTRAASRQGRRR